MKVLRREILEDKETLDIVNYPRHDNGIIEGLSDNIKFYHIIDNPPPYDRLTHRLIIDGYDFIETGHIGEAYKLYRLEQLTNDEIIANLNNSLGEHLDNNYPAYEETKHLAQILRLSLVKNKDTWNTQDNARFNYMLSMGDWQAKCRDERDRREEELINNGVLPSFEWDEKPDKPVLARNWKFNL